MAGLFGCNGGSLVAVGTLSASPQSLSFDATQGDLLRFPVALENGSTESLNLTLKTSAGFDVTPSTLTLAPGEHVSVSVGFDGPIGETAGSLGISGHRLFVEVGLHGVMHPRCGTPPTPCQVYQATAQACVLSDAPDGTACTDGCVAGVCSRGACVGQALACDDQNACTVDSCGPKGCVHQPLRCVSTDPCQAPSCDPGLGCIFTTAPDGTTCGSSDCSTSHVCLAGRCTAAPTPDGTACGEPAPCQEIGTCQARTCVRPDKHSLFPEWTLQQRDPQESFDFPGVVDAAGDLFWFDSDGRGDWWLDSVDVHGQARFQVKIDQPRPTEEPEWPGGAPGWLSLVGQQLLLVPWTSSAQLEARDATSGASLWIHDFGADLAQGQSCPGGWSSWVVSPPVALGGSTLAVETVARCVSGLTVTKVFDLDATGTIVNQHPVAQWTGTERDLIGDGLGDSLLCGSQALDEYAPHSTTRTTFSLQSMRGEFNSEPTTWSGRLINTAFELVDLNQIDPLVSLGPTTGAPNGLSPVMGDDLIGLFPYGVDYWAFDGEGHFKWRYPFATSNVSSPILTDTGGSLFLVAGAAGVSLVLIGGDGHPVFTCNLGDQLNAPSLNLQPGSIVLQNERLVWSGLDRPNAIRSFSVPGLRPAQHGWITAGGNMQRTHAPLP